MSHTAQQMVSIFKLYITFLEQNDNTDAIIVLKQHDEPDAIPFYKIK